MRVAANSNTHDIAKHIVSVLKEAQTIELDAIGDKATANAVQSVTLAQEQAATIYPVEHTRYEAEVDGKPKTVHRMTVYR